MRQSGISHGKAGCDGAQFAWTSKIRRTLFVLPFFVSGCVVEMPLPGSAPEELGGDQLVIGMKMEEILEQIGDPDWHFQKDETDLLLYEKIGDRHFMPVVWAIYPVPLPYIGTEKNMAQWCMLLEFDNAGILKERTVDSKLEADPGEDCAEVTWTPEEFKALLIATAENGDKDAAFELAKEFDEPKFIRILAERGDYDAAMLLARRFDDPSFIRKLAEQGDKEAAIELARMFDDPTFIRELAEQGDKEAAIELAKMFDEPKFIRDLAKQGDKEAAIELAKGFDEWGPLKQIARQGNTQAAVEIAERLGNLELLKELAEQGDTAAAFKLYELAIYNEKPAQEALKWLCVAANEGHPRSQITLAHTYRSWGKKRGWDIEEDRRIAYMWYTLAAENGAAGALISRSTVADEMTPEEEAEALEMIRNWEPGQCPTPDEVRDGNGEIRDTKFKEKQRGRIADKIAILDRYRKYI